MNLLKNKDKDLLDLYPYDISFRRRFPKRTRFPNIKNMKKAYLIHGWGGSSSSEPWLQWIKKELEKKKFEVISFDMPNTEKPKIEEWVKYLEDRIKDVDEKTYFIGHSIGCQTILRFLEKIHRHKRIGGCVFVAGWFNVINLEPEELAIAHPWMNTGIEFERVLDHCNKFLAIFSDNDPYVHLDEAEKFKTNLGAKIIIKKGQEHFNSTEKIPEILEFL
ncbi:alpha/beta fold hydrolase [Candidatus Pacearchaeota archaeon]|nr:alpha/beta fold hydrolase [Candidatus Pacearchaeota archaeon]